MKSWLDSQINLAKTTHQRRQKALVSFHVPHLHSLVCIQRGCRCKRSFSAIEWITMDQSLQHHCKMQDGPVGFRGLARYSGFTLGPSPLSGVHMWSLVSLREHCFTQGHMIRLSSIQCLFYIRVKYYLHPPSFEYTTRLKYRIWLDPNEISAISFAYSHHSIARYHRAPVWSLKSKPSFRHMPRLRTEMKRRGNGNIQVVTSVKVSSLRTSVCLWRWFILRREK